MAKSYEKCKLHRVCPKFGCNRYCLDCMNGALCSISIQNHHNFSDKEVRNPRSTINHGKVVFLRKHIKRKAEFIISETDFTNKCELGLLVQHPRAILLLLSQLQGIRNN
ncbi:hypothetical protein CFP56_007488 [Quercus suber]|uniref:Uncharacterized protein n=1 Tax=Quercus suber TaxID=58331 RepID=A0AAW0L554_QUESU